MKKTITVKGVTIGEGLPKICVPMVSQTKENLVKEARNLRDVDLDMIEWRVDYFQRVENIQLVKETLTEIREVLPNTPLLFTFRTKKEGGEKEADTDFYLQLNKEVAETGLVDFIDVELFTGEKEVQYLIKVAHNHNVYVVVSNHDFEKTPPRDEMIARLKKAQQLGGDLPKMAVMPKSRNDVLTLLDATLTMSEKYADRPIITMSMSGLGMVSRLAGEVFGSALTFAAVEKASAPGQVPISELKNVLALLHNGIK